MAFTADAAFQLLATAHAQDRLAHAYLITGPTGAGKLALATRLAAHLLGTDAPLAHPDCHRIEPESKSRRIVIEQVRELEHTLHMRSLMGGKKVGLLIDADRLQPAAANAFLKTLEEPPAGTHHLQTARNDGFENLLGLRAEQEEMGAGGRLFEGFEKGVGGGGLEAVGVDEEAHFFAAHE